MLIFDGPAGSGKTTTLKTLEQIVYRGMMLSSYSAKSIARRIDAHGNTMLLDETSDILWAGKGAEFFSTLKSTFSAGGTWERIRKNSSLVRRYDTYTSIAISVNSDVLPEDVYNCGIRIGMSGLPDNVKLGDIHRSQRMNTGNFRLCGCARSSMRSGGHIWATPGRMCLSTGPN